MKDIPAAVYLLGHGPYREPRLLELQYLRIVRYCELFAMQRHQFVDIRATMCDVNHPRVGSATTSCLRDLPQLAALCAEIELGNIEVVFIDIAFGAAFNSGKYLGIPRALKHSGATVYNCYYDDEQILLTELRSRFGDLTNPSDLPRDYEEIVSLFPRLAAGVADEIVAQAAPNRENGTLQEVLTEISHKRAANPYKASKLPWMSVQRIRELLDRRQ